MLRRRLDWGLKSEYGKKCLTQLNHVCSARHQNLHFITNQSDVEVQGDPKPLPCRLKSSQERE